MNQKLTPEDLREIFVNLQATGLDAILVGGQAVNLWAYQYSSASPKLQKLLPFATEDLDFYGGRVEATICGYLRMFYLVELGRYTELCCISTLTKGDPQQTCCRATKFENDQIERHISI